MDWTEKYRPQSLKAIVGNGPAISALAHWGESWKNGPPKQRAVILAGTPGVGKTTAALALARDMGWSVVELNASDARNADTIRKVATAGALHQTFALDGAFHSTLQDGGRKLIILDEADNLYERLSGESAAGGSDLSDKGGKKQIVDTIRQTQQPIILIVNDLYELKKGSGSTLATLALEIKFQKVQGRSMPNLLDQIARNEGVTVDRAVLEDLAQKSAGDLRAAVRDLQALCTGRTHVTVQDLGNVGYRDTSTSLFEAMGVILKGKRLSDVRREMLSVDSTPEDVVMWVDENLPKQYLDPRDLVAGYEMLSRADIFLGRARRTQNYGMWGYASDLAAGGVHAVRQGTYSHYGKFGFPMWIMKMSRTKGIRATRDRLADALAEWTHTSRRKVRTDTLHYIEKLAAADDEFAAYLATQLELEESEIKHLLGDNFTAPRLKSIKAIMETIPKKIKRPVILHGLREDEYAEVEDVDDEGEAAAPAKAPAKPVDKPKDVGGQMRLF